MIQLVSEGQECSSSAEIKCKAQEKHRPDDVQDRASRALRLAQLGELSAARQALEGAQLAPGDLTTLRALTDPDRRPPVPREPLTEEVATAQPVTLFELDPSEFLLCLRTARRGAAPGPSGMTSDHLFPLLESDHDSDLFCQVGSLLATGNVPTEVLEGFKLGRLTALRKPDGGVRGIVVGDIVRRLVARSMAKQIAKKVEQATSPFQYARSAKARSECVAHVVQTLTDVDPNATVVSIDGVGAYDLISRNSMLRGLKRMEDGDQVLPFVRCFYGSPSTYKNSRKTNWARQRTSLKGREGNKVIPSCLYFLHWGNTQFLRQSRAGCWMVRSCSRILTTFTSFVNLTVLQMCTPSWRKNCPIMHTSS